MNNLNRKPKAKVTKAELQNKLDSIHALLVNAKVIAKDAANAYSTELPSRLAFEVGYLNGYINTVLCEIESIKG